MSISSHLGIVILVIAAAGVSILRVHDVAEMLDVVKIVNSIKNTKV